MEARGLVEVRVVVHAGLVEEGLGGPAHLEAVAVDDPSIFWAVKQSTYHLSCLPGSLPVHDSLEVVQGR